MRWQLEEQISSEPERLKHHPCKNYHSETRTPLNTQTPKNIFTKKKPKKTPKKKEKRKQFIL